MDFGVEGRTPPLDDPPSAVYRAVTPDYLRSLGIPLLGGRAFGDQDRADTAPVVLVNQTLARRFWPGAAAVGQRIRAGGGDSQEPWLTVVGVIGDARQASLTEPVRPEILFPYTQNPVAWYRSTTLVVRTKADPLALAEPVKAGVWGLDGSLPVTSVRSMAQILSDSVGQERFNAALLGGFAATALLLALVGIYGVMAYTVSRRRQEIAIRMALGARAAEVFALIVGRGLLLGGLGATLGLAGALTLSRFLDSLLFEVAPTDPATFAGLTALLMAVNLLACAIPALRAARLDPLVALRNA
jgi:putative ABC transport system permease protein